MNWPEIGFKLEQLPVITYTGGSYSGMSVEMLEEKSDLSRRGSTDRIRGW
jgi:hypothetical protein